MEEFDRSMPNQTSPLFISNGRPEQFSSHSSDNSGMKLLKKLDGSQEMRVVEKLQNCHTLNKELTTKDTTQLSARLPAEV